ncbi:hypothetical protein O0881_20995 [Janthinobacterium sp. SUN100]|uniref:hypothetical protein n=1 Tax=Janthinobacterium sp. SUN100 TaxID=3004101 RepID=UPI0025B12730|nr:hypothetical protein [Janthinobacterium sp. SUN100]MDN2704462.1 hypothetical protein [Janthinobacterium sp. SUN100]
MRKFPSSAELHALNDASVAAIQAITWRGQNIVTTELLTQLRGTEAKNTQVNHTRNLARVEQGIHFLKVCDKSCVNGKD